MNDSARDVASGKGLQPVSGGLDAGAPNWAGCAVPDSLLYDLVHDVWVALDDDVATIGMTDVAQTRCGRLVQLSWKRPGSPIKRGRPLTAIESAKWVGPFVSPLSGEVVANNQSAFAEDVAVANRDPYGRGWLYRIRADSLAEELQALSDGASAFEHYRAVIDQNDIRCFRCAE